LVHGDRLRTVLVGFDLSGESIKQWGAVLAFLRKQLDAGRTSQVDNGEKPLQWG
jgi:hypothetical protein